MQLLGTIVLLCEYFLIQATSTNFSVEKEKFKQKGYWSKFNKFVANLSNGMCKIKLGS